MIYLYQKEKKLCDQLFTQTVLSSLIPAPAKLSKFFNILKNRLTRSYGRRLLSLANSLQTSPNGNVRGQMLSGQVQNSKLAPYHMLTQTKGSKTSKSSACAKNALLANRPKTLIPLVDLAPLLALIYLNHHCARIYRAS